MSRIGIKSLVAMASLATFAVFTGSASAAIIFADFNVNEGAFNQAPNFSGTTNFTSASTADRTITDSFEGVGSEKLDLVHAATPAANRLRFLSGSGTHTNALNTQFTLTSGEDGFIGYYYKVIGTLANAVGTTMSINLDGAGGTTAELDGGVPKAIIADGAWHLAEWNLDLAADWGAAAGLGGGHGATGLVNGIHTIDSIYLQNNTAAEGAHFELLIDFVAKSDSGSVANLLVPEPASLVLFAIAGLGLCAATRRRSA